MNRKCTLEQEKKATVIDVKQSDKYNHGRIERVKTMDLESEDDLNEDDCDEYEVGKFTITAYNSISYYPSPSGI